ncbi:MAG: UDP-N-acetylglucosamine 2-epimerase (non-hydrolyzing) [Deltaproteobacteria bacterium]|nr:UDP-N-acetylglucosamine 2-epimerase (non-hydrolyzing) [Deltaproteobacteria bacterium]
MKICTIIGVRPQFIKSAVVTRAISKYKKKICEIIIHTGQHYDFEMSQIFFDQLEIPKADYHLGVGSTSHGEQTGRMLIEIEKALLKEKPDWVLVYGDTNSTLAGALAAAKLQIPVAHVESGLRSFNHKMPEEINRIIIDRISKALFAPTGNAIENLRKEGIIKGVYHTPDVMEESMYYNLPVAERKSNILNKLGCKQDEYVFSTVHRAENTDNPEHLKTILHALNRIAEEMPVILAVHPRTKKVMNCHGLEKLASRVNLVGPLSYIDSLKLEKNAKAIMTDSGGMQKEAMWLNVPCITMRDETEWIETVERGYNTVTGRDTAKIVNAFNTIKNSGKPDVYSLSDVRAGEKILQILSER